MNCRHGIHCAPLLALFALVSWTGDVTYAQEQAPQVPLFDGLGNFSRTVSTKNALAQRYFNQGLAWLYAFNHDEAIRSFTEAARLDPQLAMAWWGVALAHGPHINKPAVTEESAKAAWEALGKARTLFANASPIEREMIEALAARYADPQPEDRNPLDHAYAAAMRKLWLAHRDDPDIGALFAESLMDLRPWDLWTSEGKPREGTDEIIATLDAVIELNPSHPLALHLYVHALEASPEPGKADANADRLRNLQPGLAHLVHMPSHLDVRQGRWAEAIVANQRAIDADNRYRQLSPRQGFYNIYMAHNRAMLAYAAIMSGQSAMALKAMDEIVRGIDPAWLKENAALADAFTAMPLEVLVRFGRWDEVLGAPEPPDFLPIARSLRRASRAIAFAALEQVDEAMKEQAAFHVERAKVANDSRAGNNAAADVLAVAEHLMNGEILYRQGKVDAGIAELEEAVKCEDKLLYDEPPDWIHPVRHALGAILIKENRGPEAEAVYRQDLAKLPNNGWALFGLAKSLRMQGRAAETAPLEAQFARIWSRADIQITSSCFCQPNP